MFFPPTESDATNRIISLTITDDDIVENTEIFQITASFNGSGGEVSSSPLTIGIRDNGDGTLNIQDGIGTCN